MAVIKREFTELQTNNMTAFYNEVLNHRAIPETRDGLLEIMRRILWTCYQNKWFSSKKHIKCSKINGFVLTYHPHGDASVYNSLVNLSQNWKNQITLIDTNGNNGSIYGDPAAAPRYLEGKLSKDAEEIYLNELTSNCIDYIDNFDLSEKEPIILPARLPMYLINGAFGIPAGYSISVPTHNPVEVIDETIKLIKDSNYKVNLLPDFPTGGTILNDKNLKSAYETGRGKVVIRGTLIKDEANHRLILTEIPYMKSLDKIKDDIKNNTSDKKEGKKVIPAKLKGIKNIKDASSKNKIELIIEVKRDVTLESVEALLYKHTDIQATIPFILVGTFNRKFGIHNNVNEVLQEWIDFRRLTIKRIKLGLIKKHKFRIHVLQGLQKILDPNVIDKAIVSIKKCKNKSAVIETLMNEFNLTEVQAQKASELELYRLSSMSLSELKNEEISLTAEVNKQTEFFKDVTKIDELIINDDLLYFRNKYKNKTRLTKVVTAFNDDLDENIEDTSHTLVITKEGCVKKLPPINSQKRRGKGINVGKIKEGDYPVFVEELSNLDKLFIFTDTGKVYKFNVSEFNDGTTNSYGNYISSLVNNDKISSCVRIPNNIDESQYGILIATKFNKIKITQLDDYSNIGKNGIIASKLVDNDLIVSASLIKIKEIRHPKDIIVTHSGGNSSLIDSEDIPLIGRTTYGSLAMNKEVIEKGNVIVSASAKKDTDTHILVITKNGFGKLVNIDEFSKVKRGAKGMMCAKLKEGDSILKVVFCNLEQELTLVSNKSLIKINIEDISIVKRPTYGVSLKTLSEGEELIDISLI